MNSAPFNTFPVAGMPAVLERYFTENAERAVVRWHGGVSSMIQNIKNAMPDQWKQNAVDTANQQWIVETLLSQQLIQSLGADYGHGKIWLKSMDRFDVLKDMYTRVVAAKFGEAFADELKDAEKTFAEAKTLVALVMVYNCYYHKIAKTENKEDVPLFCVRVFVSVRGRGAG